MIADPHRANPSRVRVAECPVTVSVSDQDRGSFVPGKGFGYLSAIHSAVGFEVTLIATSRLRV